MILCTNLRAIGSRPSIRHRQLASFSVLNLEVLISELLSIDALTTSSISSSEIPTLDHEILDHSMERRALVVQGLAGAGFALLTSAQCTEVLCGLWRAVCVQKHHDSTQILSTHSHVEEYLYSITPWML